MNRNPFDPELEDATELNQEPEPLPATAASVFSAVQREQQRRNEMLEKTAAESPWAAGDILWA